MLLSRDTHLYGPEGHFVVGTDDEHAFHIFLAHILRRLGTAQPNGGVAFGQVLVLTHREGDDRDRHDVLARVGHDFRRRREIRARLGWRVHELNGDLVIHGLVGALLKGGALHRAVRDLRHPADERRVREGVDLDNRGIADADAGDIGLVDFHARLENGHVADREQRGRVLVERAGHRGLTLLDGETGHAARHRRVDRRLVAHRARFLERGTRLFHEMLGRLQHRGIHVHGRPELLHLLIAHELRIRLLHRRHALEALLRLNQVRFRLRCLRLRGRHRGLGARHRGLGLLRIDLKEELPLRDHLPLFHGEVGDLAGDVGRDKHFLGADIGIVGGHIAAAIEIERHAGHQRHQRQHHQ